MRAEESLHPYLSANVSDKYIATALRHKIQQLEQQLALLAKELESKDHVISILMMRAQADTGPLVECDRSSAIVGGLGMDIISYFFRA